MKRSKYYSRGSALVTFLVVLTIIVILGMAGFIFFSKWSHSSPTTSDTSASVAPDIPVKDFAPNIPMSQKTTILIQTSDSSDIKYIVPTDQVQTYIKSLPEGYHIVSKAP